MGTPKLSILIPTYNSAAFLRAAIESVLSQDFDDYELIISDNASTDDTESVVASFTDSRIRYVRNHTNLGPHKNFNNCLGYAKGEYLRFLCADDVLLPGVIRKQVAALDANDTLGLVTCDMYVTDQDLEHRQRVNFFPGVAKGRSVIKACCLHFSNWIGGPSNVLLRKTALEGRLFPQHLGWVGDLAFYADVLEKWDYCNIDEPGYLYRRHAGADTVSVAKRGLQRREELEFCLSRMGFQLGYAKFLGDPVGLKNKLFLVKSCLAPANLKKFVRMSYKALIGKSYKAMLLADYFGAHVSDNIAYSKSNGILLLGKGTYIGDYTVIRIENGPFAEKETSTLVVGANTYIGEHNNIRAAGGVISIGDNVLISQFVTIVASNHGTDLDSPIMTQKWIRNTVVIEDDVWIGAGAVILPGAHISRGSIIAAKSVVKGFVEPNSIMAGAPAKKVKSRE